MGEGAICILLAPGVISMLPLINISHGFYITTAYGCLWISLMHSVIIKTLSDFLT